MGIPIDGAVYIFGNNKLVLVNSSIPTSELRKKSNSIVYHLFCEGSASDDWSVAYVNTKDNVADILTEFMSNGEKRRRFIEMILHYVFWGGDYGITYCEF